MKFSEKERKYLLIALKDAILKHYYDRQIPISEQEKKDIDYFKKLIEKVTK